MMGNRSKKNRSSVSELPRRRESGYGMYRLISLVGLFLIAGMAVVIGAQAIQQYKIARELAVYEERIMEQTAKQEALMEEIDKLDSLEYLEVLARDRLGLVKPGEIIFQFED